MELDYKKHQHNWYKRTKPVKSGWYVTGYICQCGKKDYVDLLQGIPSENKVSQRMEEKV